MEALPGTATPRRSLRIILLLLAFLGLVASRRWQQLTSPQVWAEDGGLISSFVASGWGAIGQPVNGYLVLVPKVITGASLLVSLYDYPIVSTILACLFAALVGAAVAASPTHLKGRALCAACVFLVPSDTEVFGLPLYTLWWAPILLLLVALWDEGTPALLLRLLFVALGGLSSPYILVVLPILYIRAVRFRKLPSEIGVALAATVVAAVQVRFIVGGAHMATPPLASFLRYVVPRFCGWFLLGGLSENGWLLWPAGILVLGLIAGYLLSNRRDPFAWILVFLYVGAVASSVMRNDPAALHPFRGGPRYFFFPFFLTSWILIGLALTAERTWLRRLAATVALGGALNALPQWTRFHDDLHWHEHLVSARLFSEYAVPIESDGHWFRAWSLEEPGETWDNLLRKDRFLPAAQLEACPTFAYRVLSDRDLASGSGDSQGAPSDRCCVLVASTGAGKDTLFQLSASRRIRFRSGPAQRSLFMEVVGHERQFIPRLPLTSDWVTLEFSNSELPPDFTIRIEDHGQGVGEWALVAP